MEVGGYRREGRVEREEWTALRVHAEREEDLFLLEDQLSGIGGVVMDHDKLDVFIFLYDNSRRTDFFGHISHYTLYNTRSTLSFIQVHYHSYKYTK